MIKIKTEPGFWLIHYADAVDNIQRCTSCRMLTSNEVCNLCEDNSRDDLSICVVENPSDVLAIESTGGYKVNTLF